MSNIELFLEPGGHRINRQAAPKLQTPKVKQLEAGSVK